ncbi:MAG: hypothetical protein ACRD2O_13765 [Terriglobia bacterium]
MAAALRGADSLPIGVGRGNHRLLLFDRPPDARLYQPGIAEEVWKAANHGNQKFHGGLEHHILSAVTSGKTRPAGGG